MNEFQKKLKSLGFSKPGVRGKDDRRPVIHEDTGEIGGYQIEHWDGSQSAEVRLKPVDLTAEAELHRKEV